VVEEERQPEEETEEPAAEEAAPEASETEEPAAEEAAAEESAADESVAEEAAAEEPASEEAEQPAAEEPASEDTEPKQAAPEAVAAPEEPAEELSPKAKRKLERSRASGPALPPRTPEERAAARIEARAAKAEARRRYRSRRGRREGEPGRGTPPAERRPGPKKVRVGTVVSTKAEKTITVRIEVARRHPAYEKIVRRSSTVHAHDERNEANEGDVVRVVETRPLSRTKRWRLLEVLERAR
jgi:small subunit ribosomal protein S17